MSEHHWYANRLEIMQLVPFYWEMNSLSKSSSGTYAFSTSYISTLFYLLLTFPKFILFYLFMCVWILSYISSLTYMDLSSIWFYWPLHCLKPKCYFSLQVSPKALLYVPMWVLPIQHCCPLYVGDTKERFLRNDVSSCNYCHPDWILIPD